MNYIKPILGIAIFILITYLFSRSKKEVSFKIILWGVISQFIIAVFLLKLPFISKFLLGINSVVRLIQNATDKATQFMFGHLAGGATPYQVTYPENSFVVALQVLPLILTVGAISALLFHFGIIPKILKYLGKILEKTFKISPALGFGSASTIFLGTIEAPLVVKPYLGKMNPSELLALIVCSMSTIAGTVMILYASVLESSLPGALVHLMTASLISLPAAIMLSQVFIPPSIESSLEFHYQKLNESWIEALLKSVNEGIRMLVSIVAIIIVLFTFVHLFDAFLALFSPSLTLGSIMGQILRPIMWLTGFSWENSIYAAELMGTKIVLNEFVSFLKLGSITSFSEVDKLTIVYALCGFANIGSCGIIIAGLSSLVPERRKLIVKLTFFSLGLGNLATLMTACVINFILQF